jgi:aminomethyltransferase
MLGSLHRNMAPPPSRILRPGVRTLPERVERYPVPGSGSVVVAVMAGDALRLTDVEGGQGCEVLFCGPDGAFDAAALGTRPDGTGEGLKAIMARSGEGTARTLGAQRRRGIDLARARSTGLFGAESRAGNTADLTVARDGMLVVAVPGAEMSPEAQDTATPIELRITRAAPPTGKRLDILPEPLADPIHDSRIRAATANAYLVRAGEWIQVIDVSGRQCTDFQALAARKVDKGLDYALDSTVTRTLLGRSYPAPGLPSKAFDREFAPLVEIGQDTVGRHDAFATACNSRYYDDMGYPGHVNCTENFNQALAPFGVAPRKGWEAINYFYNTNIDHQNQLYLDEP